TADAVVMRAEIPGVDPQRLELSIDGDVLTLRGEKEQTHESREGHTLHTERSFGAFRRSITLPASIDSGHVDANYDRGVLTITGRKTHWSRSRKIDVKVR